MNHLELLISEDEAEHEIDQFQYLWKLFDRENDWAYREWASLQSAQF